jgi:hypothetical protein
MDPSFHHRRSSKQVKAAPLTPSCGENFSRRKNRRHVQRSRSRRASRHPQMDWTCLTQNGWTRSRRNRNRCARTIRCRHGRRRTRKIRAAGIRRYFAVATATPRSADARNGRPASTRNRRCRPQTCPSATTRRGRNASPAALAGRAARQPVCACRIPAAVSCFPWSVDHAGRVERACGQ